MFFYPFREGKASLFNIAPFRHKAIHRHLKQRQWGIKNIFKLQIKGYRFDEGIYPSYWKATVNDNWSRWADPDDLWYNQ